ncbi:glycoside hydrolase family 16 protein [Hymenobacter metallicola]|uniref:glycoside hydrolase family 16 protein n=1 Tax=Hymenobacter metallicola TaxID=2563114 RepID=UPI001436B45C|nr:family 16 glycosylhydrolase [Hymenobacter metallicola]
MATVGWGLVVMVWSLGRCNEAQAQCATLNLQAPHWELVFADEFDKPTLNDTLWTTVPGGLVPYQGKYPGWGSEYFPQPGDSDYDSRLLTITPNDASDPTVKGVLHLTALPLPVADSVRHSLNHKGADQPRSARYKSAMIRSRKDYPAYGAYIMRARLPRARDYQAWPTFWLWSCGTEIDILDGVGVDKQKRASYLVNVIDNIDVKTVVPEPNTCFAGPFAYPELVNGTPGTKQQSPYNQQDPKHRGLFRRKSSFDTDYNTYAMVWTPEKVVFYFNETAVFTVPRSDVRTLPKWHSILVTMQMFIKASKQKAYTMDVDYIRVYKTKMLKADGVTPNYEAIRCE